MTLKKSEQLPLIALVGPPNAGKTTLFNYLSGKNFKTVNYPGSTIEYHSCDVHSRFNLKAILLDSPGIVSIIPNSPDEEVTIKSLYEYKGIGSPDIIIVTCDASQLSRHLLLVKQLISSGFNVIIALTMLDILQDKGFQISIPKLEKKINCKVIKIDGRTGKGVFDLLNVVKEQLDTPKENKILKPDPRWRETSFLLNAYKEIEEIEKEVIEPITPLTTETNLENPEKSLEKINSKEIKLNTNTPDSRTLKFDKIILHPVWGIIIFFFVMAFTFTAIFWFALPLMDLVNDLFSVAAIESIKILGHTWYGDLISNGIISGTGSVIVFVPQIIILFLILGFLEDTGYLARGAMLVDKPLSKVGLNGRSFVPMLSGFACAIPAMLAARTIPNKRERLLTIFIIPLMTCSARLPVYTLLIAFLIPQNKAWIGGLTLASIYIFSIVLSVIVASIINRFNKKLLKTEDNSSFMLELPAYRIPKLRVILHNTLISSKAYLKKAGPVILVFSIILWLLTYFPNYNPKVNTSNLTTTQILEVKQAKRLASSYSADLGKIIEPLMTPLGMDWRVGVALISTFAAREVFVSSLALIFKVTDTNNNLQNSLLNAMKHAKIEGTNKLLFTTSTIVGLIVFFMFAMQCMSTLATSLKETGGWRIPLLQVLFFTSLAYFFTFIAVNGLRFLGVA